MHSQHVKKHCLRIFNNLVRAKSASAARNLVVRADAIDIRGPPSALKLVSPNDLLFFPVPLEYYQSQYGYRCVRLGDGFYVFRRSKGVIVWQILVIFENISRNHPLQGRTLKFPYRELEYFFNGRPFLFLNDKGHNSKLLSQWNICREAKFKRALRSF